MHAGCLEGNKSTEAPTCNDVPVTNESAARSPGPQGTAGTNEAPCAASAMGLTSNSTLFNAIFKLKAFFKVYYRNQPALSGGSVAE